MIKVDARAMSANDGYQSTLDRMGRPQPRFPLGWFTPGQVCTEPALPVA